MRGDSLNLHITSPLYAGETGNTMDPDSKWIGHLNKLSMLDSSAVFDGKFVNISIVNRDQDNDIETAVVLEGSYKDKAQVFTLYDDDINICNTFESSPVKPVESTVQIKELLDGYKIKKHSWCLIRVEVA
jgi:alpha-L-arabinofuranosidase